MKKTLISAVLCIAAFFPAAAQQPHNAAYPDDPAYHQLPDEERGEMIHIQAFKSQKYFPGTERDIWIYVPKQYTAEKPACLLVGFDGVLMGADKAMDNLIKSGEMPVTIGIFLTSGTIYDADRHVLRYNRSNEWDTMSDRLASFVEEEIIPLAESRTTSSGLAIKISRDANDRAAYGASSGGIASFAAAWYRPDLYSRVYSGVGTYIAFRGGNDFPALVRKTEPKRIRIFLQDGCYDTWNPSFGDWFEQNQLMESALDFAGYEMSYKWDRGGHGITHGAKMFPDAMRWLWKGWPAPVGKGKSLNNYIKNIIPQEGEWKEIACNLAPDATIVAVKEGMTALQQGNSVTFYSNDGVSVKTISLKKGERIVGTDRNGELLTSALCPVKNAIRVLTACDGSSYVATSDGKIWYVNGKEKKIVNEMADGIRDIAVYPDWTILAQSLVNGNQMRSYICNGDSLLYGQDFYWLHSTGGRLAYDTDGVLYVATPEGVQICDQNGRVRIIMGLPSGAVTDIAFNGDKLFVISGGKLFLRTLNHKGYNSWKAEPAPKSEGQG